MRGHRLGLWLSLMVVGCLEQNARWDPPQSSTSSTSAGESTSDGQSGTTSSSTGAVLGPTDSDVSTSDASSGSSSSTGEGPEPCEGNWRRICDGECRDTKSDPQACGLTCLDCTQFLGPDARCKNGICRP